MKRSVAVLAGLALALTAAPAAAQAPYIDEFTFGGVLPSQVGSSTPISPYNGSLLNTPLNDELVWCVDLDGSRNWSGDAWVTSMGQFDFSQTELGGGSRASYRWAAFFASQMDWYEADGGVTGPNAFNINLQRTIWRLLGYNIPQLTEAQANAFLNTNAATFGFAPGTTLDDLRAASPTLEFFDYRRWVVITRVDCVPGGPCSPSNAQEYIGRRPDVPTEVVPEPATMTLLATGLAGMAAARRRRKTA